MAPLLAGVRASELSGPLSLLNALSANNDAQLHQLLADIAGHLGLPLQPAASYVRNVSAVKALADAIADPAMAQPVSALPAKQKLNVTVTAEGTPPSQVLKIVANRQVEVSRVEYMLSFELLTDSLVEFVHAHRKRKGFSASARDLPHGYCHIGIHAPLEQMDPSGYWRSVRSFDTVIAPKQLLTLCACLENARLTSTGAAPDIRL